MTKSEKEELSTKKPCGNEPYPGMYPYYDEISLMDYFLILWKHRYLIFLLSVLPAAVVGVILFLWPSNHSLTYVYDVSPREAYWGINEKSYALFLNRFYSEQNLTKLAVQLQNEGLKQYAEQIRKGNQSNGVVKFEVTPPFIDTSRINITNPAQLSDIRNMKASLLHLIITGKSIQDLDKLSMVIRENIDNVIPLHSACDYLTNSIREYNSVMAEIENNRFNLELSLKTTNEILAGLRKVDAVSLPAQQEGAVLQFNIGEKNQYLPLSSQIQATESERINLEKTIQSNQEKYAYYKDLLEMDSQLLAELNSKLDSNYTLQQYRTFLAGLVDATEKSQLKDHLISHLRLIENVITWSRPAAQKPIIYPVPKGTIKKTGIVFATALLISILAAFVLENSGKK